MKINHFVPIAKLWLSAKRMKHVPEQLDQTLFCALQKAHCSSGAEFKEFTEARSMSRTKGHICMKKWYKIEGCTKLCSYNCTYERKLNYFPQAVHMGLRNSQRKLDI